VRASDSSVRGSVRLAEKKRSEWEVDFQLRS
jgi:hypothetical protein